MSRRRKRNGRCGCTIVYGSDVAVPKVQAGSVPVLPVGTRYVTSKRRRVPSVVSTAVLLAMTIALFLSYRSISSNKRGCWHADPAWAWAPSNLGSVLLITNINTTAVVAQQQRYNHIGIYSLYLVCNYFRLAPYQAILSVHLLLISGRMDVIWSSPACSLYCPAAISSHWLRMKYRKIAGLIVYVMVPQ